MGTETSKYREEKKSNEILRVVASEMGRADIRYFIEQQNGMESPAKRSDSLVCEIL